MRDFNWNCGNKNGIGVKKKAKRNESPLQIREDEEELDDPAAWGKCKEIAKKREGRKKGIIRIREEKFLISHIPS